METHKILFESLDKAEKHFEAGEIRLAQKIVNERVAGISYPHATPTCSQGPDSFIKKTGCWRTASKLLVSIDSYSHVHSLPH